MKTKRIYENMCKCLLILDEMIHNTRGCTSSDKIRNNILKEAKERIQKETSNENNERYFVFFYIAKAKNGNDVSGTWGFKRKEVPSFTEVLNIIKNGENRAFIIIYNMIELSMEDFNKFCNLHPNE